MTLKSALQDVRETTLAAVSGRLGKLLYLGSLRREHGGYHHWGMMQVYGTEAAERALKTAAKINASNANREDTRVRLRDLAVSDCIVHDPRRDLAR